MGGLRGTAAGPRGTGRHRAPCAVTATPIPRPWGTGGGWEPHGMAQTLQMTTERRTRGRAQRTPAEPPYRQRVGTAPPRPVPGGEGRAPGRQRRSCGGRRAALSPTRG